MQITKVQEQKNGYLVNDSMFVPQDEQNSDFQKIQKWIKEGGDIEKYDALPEAKMKKIAEIKAARDIFMYSDVNYSSQSFINSLISGNNLIAAIALAHDSISWLDSSGKTVVLTISEARELASLMIEKRSAGYFKETNFQAEVAACKAIGELSAININFQ